MQNVDRAKSKRHYAFKPERSMGIGVKQEAGMTQGGAANIGYKK
jgi:hypothetical protein